MAKLTSLNRLAQAEPAPDEVPDDALVLIEIDGQVYKISFAALLASL